MLTVPQNWAGYTPEQNISPDMFKKIMEDLNNPNSDNPGFENFGGYFNPKNWSAKGMKGAGSLLSGIGGIWGAYQGKQAHKLATEQFEFNKKLAEGQYANTADSLNNQIAQKNRYLGFAGTPSNAYSKLDRDFLRKGKQS